MPIKHINKKAVNWLIYKKADEFMAKYKKYFNGTLYDLGMGVFPYKDFLSSQIEKYVGVGRSYKEHDPNAEIDIDFNKTFPFDDNSADTLAAISLMVELYDPQTFANECHRVLKKDGYMIIEVPFQWRVHKAPHDYFRYTPYAFDHLFKKAGFSEIQVEPCCGFFSTWFLKMNYFTHRTFVKGPKALRMISRTILIPFWYLGQVLGPLLDKIDKDPVLEPQAYWVVVKK